MDLDSESNVQDDLSSVRNLLSATEQPRRPSLAGATITAAKPIEGDSRPGVVVILEEWLERNKHDCIYSCIQVKDNEQFIPSQVVVTEDSLYILHGTDNPGEAVIYNHRPLTSIMKITTKKKAADVIKIQYGMSTAGGIRITDLDRLHVPKKSAKVIASIKKMMQLHRAPAAAPSGANGTPSGVTATPSGVTATSD